jgi:hypothetical protein
MLGDLYLVKLNYLLKNYKNLLFIFLKYYFSIFFIVLFSFSLPSPSSTLSNPPKPDRPYPQPYQTHPNQPGGGDGVELGLVFIGFKVESSGEEEESELVRRGGQDLDLGEDLQIEWWRSCDEQQQWRDQSDDGKAVLAEVLRDIREEELTSVVPEG